MIRELTETDFITNGVFDRVAWERRVFENSSEYSVVTVTGKGERERRSYRTFPEAMLVALELPRSLLYAITATGRQAVIPIKEFNEFLSIYNKLTGQRLAIPEKYRDRVK